MNLHKHLYGGILLIFLTATCAKQTSPTGGPKDTIPPRLINAEQIHGAVNFNGDQLTLEFTELIQLNNPREEVLITPSIGDEFELTAKRNIVSLDFNAPLQPNTTYTFTFREAIQDLTERNPVRDLQIALSTGSYLDSLSIEGTAYDLLSGKPLEDATVAIHPPIDTFSIFDDAPQYLTKTDEHGHYALENLKHNTYYPYAINDKNRNLRADSRTEAYAFYADPLSLNTDTSAIDLYLLRLDARPLEVTSARTYNTYFNIKTNKNLKNFNLSAPSGEHLAYGFGEDRANIRIYNTFQETDSLLVNMRAIDSIGFNIDTAFYVKFPDRDVTPEPFTLAVDQTKLLTTKGKLSATLTFSKPLLSINFDSVYFVSDSITTLPFDASHFSYDQPTRRLTIARPVPPEPQDPTPIKPDFNTRQPGGANKPEKINKLVFGRGAFMSAENDSSAQSVQQLQPLPTEKLSWIIFDIRTTAPAYIVQIVDRAGNVIQQKHSTPKGQFEDLPPAEYRLRVVIDENANGQWDPGNYYERIQPEMMLYYRDETGKMAITTKPNFEIQLAPMLITP